MNQRQRVTARVLISPHFILPVAIRLTPGVLYTLLDKARLNISLQDVHNDRQDSRTDLLLQYLRQVDTNPDIGSDKKNTKRRQESHPFTDDIFGHCSWPAGELRRRHESNDPGQLRAGATTTIKISRD